MGDQHTPAQAEYVAATEAFVRGGRDYIDRILALEASPAVRSHFLALAHIVREACDQLEEVPALAADLAAALAREAELREALLMADRALASIQASPVPFDVHPFRVHIHDALASSDVPAGPTEVVSDDGGSNSQPSTLHVPAAGPADTKIGTSLGSGPNTLEATLTILPAVLHPEGDTP